jgi:hypothetical protein
MNVLFILSLVTSSLVVMSSHGGKRDNSGRKTDAAKRAASVVVGESPFAIASEQAAKKHKQDQSDATVMGVQASDPMTPEDDWSCCICTFKHGDSLRYLTACNMCGAEKGTVNLTAAADDDDMVPAPPAAGGGDDDDDDDDENNGSSSAAPATAAADDRDVPMFEAIAEQGDRATSEAQSTGATVASAVDHVAAAVALRGEAGVLTLAGLFSTMLRVFLLASFRGLSAYAPTSGDSFALSLPNKKRAY